MSIRLRLAVWYGGLTGLAIVVVCAFLYAAHSRAHYDDLDRILEGSAAHVAAEYERGTATPEQPDIAPSLVARTYDADGRLLAASAGADLLPVVDPRAILARPSGPPFDAIVGLAPPFVETGAGGGAFGLVDDRDGRRWRLYVLPVEGPTRYVETAAPLDRIDASIAGFRRLVLALGVVGAVLAFTTGGLLAGRALRPVAALTETAGAIARSRGFDRRVPVSGGRDELGRLAATFNEMLTSLERAYEAEQRFVSDASHELRAPLTAIQANLELLERQTEMPSAERAEAVAEASREARRLGRLVGDLLALARADAGVPLRRQRVELDRVVLDVVGEARHLTRGQTIEVGALEPSVVEGDQDRLKQLLLILVDNAIKYTPAGGAVRIELRRRDRVAEVTVRDTGVGIPAEALPRVFERFYRADPARARDPGGTGLGLPIARWIAEQHGGQIALTSQPGEGTTATITLPRSA